MIAFIKGIVASYTSDSVIVNHNGMGWEIAYPHTDALSLNAEVVIYTYLHIFEGGMNLYGFSSQQEKDLFLRLISVKGLGPKTAMNMLAKKGFLAKGLGTIEINEGYINVVVNHTDEVCQVVLETLVVTLETMVESYGRFIKISKVEV